MKWDEAYQYMLSGGKIKRENWLKNDYLYIKDNIVYCDGGYPYISIKSENPLKYAHRGYWIKAD